MTLVDALSTALARHTSRRGFLTKTALVGSALSVAPVAYSLRPGTAYAAICNCSGSGCDCGAPCCDGYTAFCCELTGQNACPPGTLMAGWWKVDSSGFCSVDGVPQPRYYMDCNLTCPEGCGCGSGGICPNGCSGANCGCHLGCGSRKIDCVRFRYGNCNQNVACVGPIKCRVVTCTPPWLLDPTCTTTARVDEGTRFHHAPCLEADSGNPDGRLVSVSLSPGGIRVVGYARDPDVRVRISAGSVVLGEVEPDLQHFDVGQPATLDTHWFKAEYLVVAGAHGVCATVVDGLRTSVIGCQTIAVPNGDIIGSFDVVVGGPETIRVVGWAIDPDTTEPVDVHVWADGVFLGAGVADRPRLDTMIAYPAFGAAHGFDVEVAAPPGTRSVCVYAIDRAGLGPNPALGCRDVLVPTDGPLGGLDLVGPQPHAVRVTGWAVDPDTAEPLVVHVYVDNVVAGSGLADLDRPDIAAIWPAYGSRHGYDIVVPAEPGLSRRVCVYAIDRKGGHLNRLIACSTVIVPTGNPRGALDVVAVGPGVVRLAGWAVDPDEPGSAVTILVRIDGHDVIRAAADLDRADLRNLFTNAGTRHGYDISVPTTSGSRVVEALALSLGPRGDDLVLRSMQLVVP